MPVTIHVTSLDPSAGHANERGPPKNRKKIEWKLLTDLPVQSRGDAIESTKCLTGICADQS